MNKGKISFSGRISYTRRVGGAGTPLKATKREQDVHTTHWVVKRRPIGEEGAHLFCLNILNIFKSNSVAARIGNSAVHQEGLSKLLIQKHSVYQRVGFIECGIYRRIGAAQLDGSYRSV